MRIDLYSDIVCPFCFIGKAHLDQAIANVEKKTGQPLDITLHLHSFELDPSAPTTPQGNLVEKIAKKYNISMEQSLQSQQSIAQALANVGANFDYNNAKFGNTFDAHRLIHLAAESDKATEVNELLMRAYLEHGQNIADHDVLRGVAKQAGLNSEAVDTLLQGTQFSEEVRADEAHAHQMNISAVPFFIFENTYALSGAQPVEIFEQALQKVIQETSTGQACNIDGSGC